MTAKTGYCGNRVSTWPMNGTFGLPSLLITKNPFATNFQEEL